MQRYANVKGVVILCKDMLMASLSFCKPACLLEGVLGLSRLPLMGAGADLLRPCVAESVAGRLMGARGRSLTLRGRE